MVHVEVTPQAACNMHCMTTRVHYTMMRMHVYVYAFFSPFPIIYIYIYIYIMCIGLLLAVPYNIYIYIYIYIMCIGLLLAVPAERRQPGQTALIQEDLT